MAETPVIRIDGLEELEAKLRKMLTPPVYQKALRRLGEEVKLRAIPYPPEGAWNQPGPYPARWYQRHFGPRWARKGGGIGGRNTSERMQQHWVVSERGQLSVEVGNTASYAPFVMGEEQVEFHRAHGWRKLSEIAREELPRFSEYLREELGV